MLEHYRVVAMEHADPNKSKGEAATKYTITISRPINATALWSIIDDGFGRASINKESANAS